MVIIRIEYWDKTLNNFNGIVYSDFSNYKTFRKNNKPHRYYGPALSWGIIDKEWYFNSKYCGYSDHGYNQKQFLKDINKLWLL